MCAKCGTSRKSGNSTANDIEDQAMCTESCHLGPAGTKRPFRRTADRTQAPSCICKFLQLIRPVLRSLHRSTIYEPQAHFTFRITILFDEFKIAVSAYR